MVDPARIGRLLERVAQGVAAHDRENPDHHTWGIGMANFDIERLDLEVGEELIPGIVLQADDGVSGAVRILCDGGHDSGEEESEEEEEVVEAISEQELVIPLRSPGETAEPPRIRPPF